MRIAADLFARGVFLSGIRPPTVADGTCRLRATLMADHAPEQLRQAAQLIVAAVQREQAAHG
jgi:glycine C-acetyltransferase/8-amino-7-oxononanoate synthase